MDVKNLFANISTANRGEEFLPLFENANVKIERIVSHAQASPAGFWYDQEEDEWVAIIRGTATLEFVSGEQVELKAGDYLTIARHVQHRVARTSEETIWLAVHLK
ncbi:MAG: cupin domain-containing protein [Candidatus Binatia bacterium]